ncbi:MAG: ABC transporter substrate-binding protein, partial [Pseudomonadota bacterium]
MPTSYECGQAGKDLVDVRHGRIHCRTYSTTLAEYSGQGITYRGLNTKTDGKRAVVRATVEQPGGPSIDI